MNIFGKNGRICVKKNIFLHRENNLYGYYSSIEKRYFSYLKTAEVMIIVIRFS